MDLKQELDLLLAAVQEKQRRENHALYNIASVLHRYSLASGELIELGNTIDDMRNPPPLPSEDAPPQMAPPHMQEPPVNSVAQAEAEVQAQWDVYRHEAKRRTFATE